VNHRFNGRQGEDSVDSESESGVNGKCTPTPQKENEEDVPSQSH